MDTVLWVPIGLVLLLAVVGVWAALHYGEVRRKR
ncbi:hypothetical protein SAMN05428996_2650 [Quadrisphaera sp. DSM 44207]|nr:hypothetical protein SAMN05428996_2650 [Quadrisphaera sp. DSM 44207]